MPNLIEILCRHLDFELILLFFCLQKSPLHFLPPINGAVFFEQQNETFCSWLKEFKCVAANKFSNKIVNCAVIRLIKNGISMCQNVDIV